MIVIYNPSAVYGGHEEMFGRMLGLVPTDYLINIVVVCNAKNGRFILETQKIIGEQNVVGLPINEYGLMSVVVPSDVIRYRNRSLYDLLYKIKTGNRFRRCIFLVVQGGVGAVVSGVRIAQSLRYRIATYIPMLHSPREMGQKNFQIRSVFHKRVMRYFSYWFVITERDKERAITSGVARKTVVVVKNFLHEEQLQKIKIIGNNYRLRDPKNSDVPSIGCFGRMENRQKRQVVFLEEIHKYIEKEGRIALRLNIYGDGPDKRKVLQLRDLINEKIGSPQIQIFPWPSSESETFHRMAECDVVVIPSRFEGTPLVMMYALALGVRVFAMPVDGMLDWLDDKQLGPTEIALWPQMLEDIRPWTKEESENRARKSQLKASNNLSAKVFWNIIKMIHQK